MRIGRRTAAELNAAAAPRTEGDPCHGCGAARPGHRPIRWPPRQRRSKQLRSLISRRSRLARRKLRSSLMVAPDRAPPCSASLASNASSNWRASASLTGSSLNSSRVQIAALFRPVENLFEFANRPIAQLTAAPSAGFCRTDIPPLGSRSRSIHRWNNNTVPCSRADSAFPRSKTKPHRRFGSAAKARRRRWIRV